MNSISMKMEGVVYKVKKKSAENEREKKTRLFSLSFSHFEIVSQNFSALPAASAPRSTAPSKTERSVGFLILRESTLVVVFFLKEDEEVEEG